MILGCVSACRNKERSAESEREPVASSAPADGASIAFRAKDGDPVRFTPGPAFAHIVKQDNGTLELARIIIFNDGATNATCDTLLKRRSPVGGSGVALEIRGDSRSEEFREYERSGDGTVVELGKPAELTGGFCGFAPKATSEPEGASTGSCLKDRGGAPTAKLTEVSAEWIAGEIDYGREPDVASALEVQPRFARGKFRAKTCFFDKKSYVERGAALLRASAEDEAAIRGVISDYQIAVMGKKGRALDTIMARDTVAFIERRKQTALTAPASEVRALDAADKLFVLLLRATIAPDVLARLSPGEVLLAIPPPVQLHFEPTALGRIDRIEGDAEEAKIWVDTGMLNLSVQARKEEGKWKLFVLGASLGMMMLADLVKPEKVDAIIEASLKKATGKSSDGLWDPPRWSASHP